MSTRSLNTKQKPEDLRLYQAFTSILANLAAGNPASGPAAMLIALFVLLSWGELIIVR